MVVHRGMLPRPRQHLDDRECRCRTKGAPPGRRTVGGVGFQSETFGAGGRPEGRRYGGGTGKEGNRGYVGAIPPSPALMVPGLEDMEHDPAGEGGEVPDGLHPGYGLPYLFECVHTSVLLPLLILSLLGLYPKFSYFHRTKTRTVESS